MLSCGRDGEGVCFFDPRCEICFSLSKYAGIVPAHNPSEDRVVQVFHRQFVLASAMIAAAVILGGAPARAEYLAFPLTVETDGVSTLAHPLASLLDEPEASGDMAGAGAAPEPQPDAQNLHTPAELVSLLWKLPQTACDFGSAGGAGTSSSSSSGPFTSPADDVSRPQVPPLELGCLLPPPTSAIHPFSVASFLFRPPRAA